MAVNEWNVFRADPARERSGTAAADSILRGERGIRKGAQCADCRVSGNREEAYVFVNLVEAFYEQV